MFPQVVKERFVPLVRPTFGEEECAAVSTCLRSGWVTTGPKVQEFQEKLSKYFDGAHVLALSSNTAGMYLSLQALGIGPGDEVITTPMTFTATANVIEVLGAKPVFVDCDPETRNIDLQTAEKAITPKTRALLPVHFAGIPVPLHDLYALAHKHNLRVIEDAAHALGSVSEKHKVGSWGDIQVFSFQANKNLSTAEGGCIVTRDAQLFETLKALHFHGFDRSAWDRFQRKGKATYDIVAPALKFNMMDIQAALGLCQFEKFARMQEQRRILFQRYLEKLASVEQLVLPADHPGHAYHLFAPLLKLKMLRVDRAEFMQALKDEGVGSSVHYNPVHLFSFYKEKYGYKEGDFPHAEAIGCSTISLPLFPDCSLEDQDYVVEILVRLLRKFQI